jgi:hypothetical protein
MAVEIQEVEVVPRPQPGGAHGPAPEEPPTGAAQPDVELQIRRTISWLRSRDLRLQAD